MFTKQKTITGTTKDFVKRDSLGYAEFTGTDVKPYLVQVATIRYKNLPAPYNTEGHILPVCSDGLWTLGDTVNPGHPKMEGEIVHVWPPEPAGQRWLKRRRVV